MLLIDKAGRKAFVKMEITKNGFPLVKNYELDFLAHLGFKATDFNVYRTCENIKWMLVDLQDWEKYEGDFYDPESEAIEKEMGIEREFKYEIL